jgi:glycine/D-amino acid oxidase-like deaminating enzyme
MMPAQVASKVLTRPMSSSGPRIIVVGGGVFGVSSAFHLARLGARVILVSEGGIGEGASGRSLSWLNEIGRAHV